jgi:hypothetical protein
VAGNGAVVADLVARDAVEIVAEKTKAGMELLKDNGLGLDLAYLFGDYSLCHLLKNKETLLNDLNDLSVADNLLGCLNDLGEVDGAVKIVDAVEVVKVAERRQTTPVIERH